MLSLTWEGAGNSLDMLAPLVEKLVAATAADIKRYPAVNNNGEHLAQLLANLNYYALRLGELQPTLEQLKSWTEKRYEIEKGLETVRLTRDEKRPVSYAQNAKYEKVQAFLDTMVNAGALHLRVQNARASARDTAEAIRSRISQIKGAIRSSS
jgi:hypothetical protein